MRDMLLAAVGLGLLAGCATTASQKTASAAERTECERMAQTMGTQTTHDHAQMKGMGANPMNLTHERCQQILAEGK